MAASTAAGGCAYNDWIGYGHGRIGDRSTRVEFLDATPNPGAILIRGSDVSFTVRVRYTLHRSREGRLVVWFTDKYGQPLAIEPVAWPIQRAAMVETLVSAEGRVPDDVWDVVLHVGVLAADEREALGDLRVMYRVRKAS